MSEVKPGMNRYEEPYIPKDKPVKGDENKPVKIDSADGKGDAYYLAHAVFGKKQSPELESFKRKFQASSDQKFTGDQVVNSLVRYENNKISKLTSQKHVDNNSGDELYKQLFDVVLQSESPFTKMNDLLCLVSPKEIRQHIMIKVADHIWQNKDKRWAMSEDLFDNRKVLSRLEGEFQYAVRESSQLNYYTVAFFDNTGNLNEFRIKKMDLIAIVSEPGISNQQIINALQGKQVELIEEKLTTSERWYDPTKTSQNPLLKNPSLKYSVRLSTTDPESYGIGIVVKRDGKNTVEEIRVKKSEFIALLQNTGMTADRIAEEMKSRLGEKAKTNPLAQLEEQLRKIGRFYTHSEKNPLISNPSLKYSVRASSDPDSYAIGVITGIGSGNKPIVQELRVKKSEFLDMVAKQNLPGEKIAEEIRSRLSGKSNEGPDITASLQQIKSISTSSRDRLEKALELQKIMNSEINLLLKEDPADKTKCLQLLATILSVEPTNIEALKTGYRKLSLLVHPDKVHSSELFQLVSDLWEKSGMKEK